MKKIWIIGIFLGILLISGCQSGKTASPTLHVQPTEAQQEQQPTATPITEPQVTTPAQNQPEDKTDTGPGCTVVSILPTPIPEIVSLFSPQGADWSRGPSDALVTIVEYSDFQCPYCARFAATIEQVEEDFPDDVRLIFRHFPLDAIHDKALLAAQASEAAGIQGKFWEMHDYLFTNREAWVSLTPEDFTKWLEEKAPEAIGLDAEQFAADLTSDEIKETAQKAWEDGQKKEIPGTPFLIINDIPYQGPTDVASMETIVKIISLEPKQFTKCPPMTIDPLKQYTATIQTEKGDIVLELYPDVAPIAVNNFIFLAKNGWYDDVTFHRVLPGFVAQAGDPTGTGLGGPGYAFVNETDPNVTFDRAGLLAMANAGPDSNGSQFFITYDATPNLNGKYTIFGEVIEGMDVVEKLTPRDPSKDSSLEPGDRIITITIDEK